ncbi:MAG: hypothetical protein ACFE9S_14815 [Candidatus Hermodarchaeota archaeon]
MGWTPPTKFTVILAFLLMVFGIFILLDVIDLLWIGFLPYFEIAGKHGWIVISLIVFFLSWFLLFLGVKLKGL